MEYTMIWPSFNTVVTGGMHDDLTIVWYCCYWWNAWWSDHRVVLCWLVEGTSIWPPVGTVLTCGRHDDLTTIWHGSDWLKTMIWPPCGTVLTGARHDDLTIMWPCVDWWNRRWSDHHVVLCWLVEGASLLSPCGTVVTSGMRNYFSLIEHSVEYNLPQKDILMQLVSVIMSEQVLAPLPILKVLFWIQKSETERGPERSCRINTSELISARIT